MRRPGRGALLPGVLLPGVLLPGVLLPGVLLPGVLLLACVAAGRPCTGPEQRPRLVVIVSVDQLRRDYLERFAPVLGDGGLRRLLTGGAVFSDAAWTHTVTSTGPGHASLGTGCLPARAGIPANEWLDRQTGKAIYCAADPDSRTVGSVDGIAQRARSPEPLERQTLGDRMRDAEPRALVISFGWKDRSALLLGGRRSNGSYWIDDATGTWVTSSAVMLEFPGTFMRHDLQAWAPDTFDGWVAELNAERPRDAWAGTRWELSLDPALALELAGPDLAPGEPQQPFPHALGSARDGVAFTERVAASPAGDRIVLAAAARALAELPLGDDERTDLLCVAFASLDYAGHPFGPDSQEVLDVFAQVDLRLAELLALLDEHVGAGRWTLVLSADHGVAPLPEQSGGRRISRSDTQAAVEAALVEAFGPAPDGRRWVLGTAKPSLYLDLATLAAKAGAAEPSPGFVEQVAVAAAGALAAQPGILAARSVGQLASLEAAGDDDGDDSGDLARLAGDVHPTRSGQVLFLLERNAVISTPTGTNHGTHHDYDRQVPLVFYGQGIAPGRYPGAASPVDAVPTLLRLLGLPERGLHGGLHPLDGRVLSEALAAPR